MPIQVYSILTRGHNIGGNTRLKSKEEAEGIYNKLLDAVTNDKPLVELELEGNKFCVRTKDITSFGINVHMEETPEERKARAIEQIERNGDQYSNVGYAECSPKMLGGGGLIGGF
jgi:hypothetical protein